MRKITLYIGSLLMLAVAGCTTAATDAVETAEPSPPGMAAFENARRLELAGNFEKAYIAYSEVLAELEDKAMYQEAVLARAGALYQLSRYGAALAALSPMPEIPETLFDCRKMGLAAKILQRMETPREYVEALWEVALDTTIHEEGATLFKAGGYAELGKIYIAGDKIERAMKCFDYAAKLYEKCGDTEKMKTCLNVRDYLK